MSSAVYSTSINTENSLKVLLLNGPVLQLLRH